MTRARNLADLGSDATGLAAQADGYAYRETVTFTSSGTFTKASYPWLRGIRVKCQGGGGGGGGMDYCAVGRAGVAQSAAGGGYAESFISDISSLASSVNVVVGSGGAGGAGGVGVSALGTAGTDGGESSFGLGESYQVSAGGGDGGGRGSDSDTVRFQVGITVSQYGTGDLIIRGGQAELGGRYGVAGAEASFQGRGGDSFLGVGGPTRESYGDEAVAGANGLGYGGGGSGACSSATTTAQDGLAGGDGAPGIVIVELYA